MITKYLNIVIAILIIILLSMVFIEDDAEYELNSNIKNDYAYSSKEIPILADNRTSPEAKLDEASSTITATRKSLKPTFREYKSNLTSHETRNAIKLLIFFLSFISILAHLLK